MKKLIVNKERKEMSLGFAALVYAAVLLLVMVSGYARGLVGSDAVYSADGSILINEAVAGAPAWRYFYMFTNQSNLLVLAWLVMYGIGCFVDGRFRRWSRNNTFMVAVTVYISITFLIVAFVLEPVYDGTFDPLAGFFTHFSTPIIMWFFFFAVRGTGEVRYRKALFILIYPFCFVILNLIIGATVTGADGKGDYAYGFINPNTYPNIAIFVLVIVALTLIFGSFGMLLIKFKKFLGKHYYTQPQAIESDTVA